MPREPLPVADFRQDLVRWRQLVSPAWLAALVGGMQPQAAPEPGWLLFEVACGGEAAFAQAHIPGAAYLDSCQFEQKPLWNKVCDDALLDLLLASGVRHDTTVILYGRNPLAAARVAHLMLYAGVRDVRLLDGGFALWQAGGHPCAAGAGARVQAVADFGREFPAHPEYLICTSQARELMAAPDGVLASIRTEAEFLGKDSGYSYISAKGDIPGARWGRAGEDGDVNSMSAYQQADGSMRAAAEIAAQWAEAGIVPELRTAFYCGTGWRASLAFFYAWLMGWPHISVYDGGWCEWSGDTSNPVLCRT